jgi:putative hemolysin
MLSTILLGTNICVVASSITARMAIDSFGVDPKAATFLTVVIMTILLLMVEIVSKDWFRQAPFERTMLFAYLLYIAFIIFYLPIRVLSMFTSYVSKLCAIKDYVDVRLLIRDDFRHLLRDSEREGALDKEAADILNKGVDFHTLSVKDIMVKKQDIFACTTTMTIAEAIQLCKERHVSRLPVHLEGKEKYVGMFSAYDAFFSINESKWDKTYITGCLRPLQYVAASESLHKILDISQKSKASLLMVIDDETKEQIGLVTSNDVVQHLFVVS